MSECPHHEDCLRRIAQSEGFMKGQIEENAKIWDAVTTIREEKASLSTTLDRVEKAVDKLADELRTGLAELRSEIMALKTAPAQRWNNVVGTIITSIITLGLGALFGIMMGGK